MLTMIVAISFIIPGFIKLREDYLKASVDLTLFSFIEKIFVLNLAILQIDITLAVSSGNHEVK